MSREGFMPRCTTAFLFMPLLLLACGDPDSPTVTRLSTDAPDYTLTKTSFGYRGSVTLSFTNANSFPVTISYCLEWPASLERRRPTDGVWVYAAWLGGGAKCLQQTVVPAGGTRSKDALLTFPDSSFAGEYRVVMDVGVGGVPEPFTSNTFTLSTGAP
jgi:hypothetical protein